MNEKIKLLAEQSGGNYGDGLEFAVVFGELKDFEKFAELIVRECAELIEHRDCRTQPAPHIYLLKEFGL